MNFHDKIMAELEKNFSCRCGGTVADCEAIQKTMTMVALKAFFSQSLTQVRNDTVEEIMGKIPEKYENNIGPIKRGFNKAFSQITTILNSLK